MTIRPLDAAAQIKGKLTTVCGHIVAFGQVRDQLAAIEAPPQKGWHANPVGQAPNRVAPTIRAAVVADAVDPLHDQRLADPFAIDLDPEPFTHRRQMPLRDQFGQDRRLLPGIPGRSLLFRVVRLYDQARRLVIQCDVSQLLGLGDLFRRLYRQGLRSGVRLKEPAQQPPHAHKEGQGNREAPGFPENRTHFQHVLLAKAVVMVNTARPVAALDMP